MRALTPPTKGYSYAEINELTGLTTKSARRAYFRLAVLVLIRCELTTATWP